MVIFVWFTQSTHFNILHRRATNLHITVTDIETTVYNARIIRTGSNISLSLLQTTANPHFVATAGVEEQRTETDTNHVAAEVFSLQGNFLDGSLRLFLATSSYSAPQELYP